MVQSFLHIVAQNLVKKFGTALDQLVIVFPNKRASLFLNEEFVSIAQEQNDTPFWAPEYQTIGDLFESLSPYTTADPIVSICRLYDIYKQHIGESDCEPIDKFYSWGEVMLSDFNEIDKQMVEADSLFRYAEDWNELSDTGAFLEDDQIDILKHYFKDFSIENLQYEKERFLQLWKKLPFIYKDFKQCLKENGILYDGALCRDVVEHERYKHLNQQKIYVFVGFNILSPVQFSLLRSIKEEGKALFYWDYDPTQNTPGLNKLIYDTCSYIDSYKSVLPNALTSDELKSSTANQAPEIDFIRTNTTNAQSRYVPQWLKSVGLEQNTAVILADESLLPQVLHTLPDTTVNITMGYALADTPILGIITTLTDLQLKGRKRQSEGFYDYYLRRVEQHPLFSLLDQELWNRAPELTPQNILEYLDQNVQAMLGNMPSNSTDNLHTPLYVEAIFRTHNALRHLIELELPISDCSLICRLLERALRSIKVPFHGEPLMGLQVMGMLEARSLDFDNIIILSANDGILPRRGTTNSLIPYCMREPFGLATENENVNVYAYNFFRLLKRARKVTMMFPSGKNESEMSRFMRQLLAETNLPITDHRLEFAQADLNSADITSDEPEKTEENVKSMLNRCNGNKIPNKEQQIYALSPSAINTYIECPKQYYYKYIQKLTIQKEITEQLDFAQFGTVFHKAAELLYKTIAPGGSVSEELLDSISPEMMTQVVEAAFKEEVFDKPDNDISGFTGQLLITKEVILTYLNRLVELDKKYAPFKLIASETNLYSTIEINNTLEEASDKKAKVYFGGAIDRMDFIEKHPKTGRPAIRIVDYKTGGKTDNKTLPKNQALEQLFEVGGKDHKKNILQTLLYADVVRNDIEAHPDDYPCKEVDIIPELIYIEHCGNSEDYDGRLSINEQPLDSYQKMIGNDIRDYFKKFLEEEMMNPNKQFICTEHSCKYCDYINLCKSPIPSEKTNEDTPVGNESNSNI